MFIHRLRYCLQVLLQRIGFDYIGGLLARELFFLFSLCFQGFLHVFVYVHGVGGYLHSTLRWGLRWVIYGLFRCYFSDIPCIYGVFEGFGSFYTRYTKCGWGLKTGLKSAIFVVDKGCFTVCNGYFSGYKGVGNAL